MREISLKIPISIPLRYLLGVIAILVVSLAIFFLLLRPPVNDIILMALFLTITAVISAGLGYGAYRTGLVDRSPKIHWTLLGGYALASLLTFLTVWVIARLMFFNQHDLLMATVLLVFASGMAMALGYMFSIAITARMRTLEQAAQEVAQGNLQVRIPVLGQDEMANLSKAFNRMAAQLQAAEAKEQELKQLRQDLIAWVGHDLQTPLASIRAIVEALADGMVEDEATVQRYLSTVQKEIRMLSDLIDDLFQMAQLDAGGVPLQCEHISISDLVSDTLESFSELAKRGDIYISGQVAPGVDPVYMDAPLIGRALNNILSNALRYTPEGGSIEVQVTSEGSQVRTTICNTGEGISDEDLPYVFERFYRGEKSRSRSTGGSGLGLAISKGIVEAHGGEIGVESAGERTCFYFWLPRNAAG